MSERVEAFILGESMSADGSLGKPQSFPSEQVLVLYLKVKHDREPWPIGELIAHTHGWGETIMWTIGDDNQVKEI